LGHTGKTLTRSALLDGTGDARPDLVDATGANSDTWTVWVNNGGILTRTLWTAPLDVTDTAMPDRHAMRIIDNHQTTQDYFDIDGDGYPDLIWLIQTVSGPLLKFCPGNGSGFGDCQPYGPAASGAAALRSDTTPSSDTTATVLDFADIDGDGRPDILK